MFARKSATPQPPVILLRIMPRSSLSMEDNNEENSAQPFSSTSSVGKKKNSSQFNVEAKAVPRTIKLCTMCGRYKGFQMRRRLFILLCIAMVPLILLASILIVFYAIVPAIVRSTIEKAELSFRSVNIEDIESDRFRLRAQLELSRTGSIAATILSPLVINVDNVGSVQNNQSIAIAGDPNRPTVVPVDSPFIVSNIEAFHKFSRSLIFEPNVIWNLKAKTCVQPISSGMPVYCNIALNKEVKLKALNSLQSVSIQSISLRRSDEQRIFADIIIEIPNPSVFSIDLGELRFSLRYDNLSIGYVKSTDGNTTLHPDLNAIPFSGELQSQSSQSYSALTTVIQNFLTGKTSRVEAVAGPDATSYPLLAVGMKGLALSVQMPPFDEQLISSLEFNSMSLVPSTNEREVILSASIDIKINSPLGDQSPLVIQTLDMNVQLMYGNDSVGMLDVSEASVQQLNSNTYRSQFNDRYLILTDTGRTYERFAQKFISASRSDPIDFRIVGFASITGSFALGPLHINGILVENNVSLVGLAGLNNVRVHGISVDGETDTALQLSINVTIVNPGITDVELKNFTLEMADGESGTVLGQVPNEVLALRPGENDITLNGLLAPRDEIDLPVVGQFFSAYLNGRTQSVKLFHPLSSGENVTAMELTISGLSMQADLEGIEAQLIRRVDVLNFGIEFDPMIVDKVHVTGQLSVLFELPSNIHMDFKALTTSIDYTMRSENGASLGQMFLRDVPVEHNQLTNELLMSFDRQELLILNETVFQEFAANLLLTSNVSVVIEGLAVALAEIRIGNITLTDIVVRDTLHLVGYDQFDNGLLSIEEVDIAEALSAYELALRVKTRIDNPSVVNILYGDQLALDLRELASNMSLGLVTINPFYLAPQSNSTLLNATGTFTITSENSAVAQQFVSRMVSGLDNAVELRGTLLNNSIGTSVPLLSMAIADLRIQTAVPGLSGERMLVREVRLKKLTALQIIGIPLGSVKTLSSRIRLKNSFSAPLSITGMDIRADYGPVVNADLQVGTVNDRSVINIGAYEELLTPNIDVKITAKLTTLVSLLTPLLAGSIPLSLSGMINVTIGNQLDLIKLPLTLLNISSMQDPSI